MIQLRVVSVSGRSAINRFCDRLSMDARHSRREEKKSDPDGISRRTASLSASLYDRMLQQIMPQRVTALLSQDIETAKTGAAGIRPVCKPQASEWVFANRAAVLFS
jgi:hypothetical protein